METSARDSYLETEVLTATPQKRQLMLIEAAIRFIEQTRRHWQSGQDEQAFRCSVRAQEIVAELQSALNHNVDPGLSKRVAGLYLFVFRKLVDANLHRDEQALDDALEVLKPQREAWEGVCRELGSTTTPENEAAVASLSPEEPAPGRAPVVEPPADSDPTTELPTGLSLEA